MKQNKTKKTPNRIMSELFMSMVEWYKPNTIRTIYTYFDVYGFVKRERDEGPKILPFSITFLLFIINVYESQPYI